MSGPGEVGETLTFRVWRQLPGEKGRFIDYPVPREPGMVVLDAVHRIQANHASDLAVRWNCKAGKCGSCGAEVNGSPRLMCMTRLDTIDTSGPITITPMKTFPLIRDLVTDVSWNYAVNRTIPAFRPKRPTPAEERAGELRMRMPDVERSQEFRKCIECFLCQDTCHVLRDAHKARDPRSKGGFYGPRWMVRAASLEMHPRDGVDRIDQLKFLGGIGYCNITRCCTEVCPEGITITDNAIIPLKERVVDRHHDPLKILWRKVFG